MVDHITRKKRKAFYEDKHTIRDGRVLLFRRKGNTRKIWQCRVKLMGLKGYVTKSTGTHIYEEAVEFSGDLFDDLRQKVKDRRPLKKHLFMDVYKIWIATLHVTQSRFDYHEKTAGRYFRQFFGKYDIEDINDAVIDDYWPWRLNYWTNGPGVKEREIYKNFAEKPAQATLRMERSTLRQLLGWAHRNGYMPILPQVKLVRVGKENPRPNFTVEEMKTLVTYMREVWIKGGKHELHRWQRNMIRSLVQFLNNTGLRPKEYRLMQWQDVWTEKGKDGVTRAFMRVRQDTKTGARVIVAQDRAWKVLRRVRGISNHTKDTDLIWCDRNGKEMLFAGKTFTALLKECDLLLDVEGKKRTLYSLRHSYITNRLLNDVPIDEVAANAGTSVQMIMKHYKHIGAAQRAERGFTKVWDERKGEYVDHGLRDNISSLD